MARYNTVSIGFHWLIALMIFCMFPLGVYMHELPFSPQKLQYYSWHKWAGVSVFLLALLRILWRITHQPPPPLPMPRWQHRAAESVHHLLYALIVLIPVSGWLMSSALGFQTVWFGKLPLPDLLDKNEALGETLKLVHKFFNISLLALVLLHVAAALKHQFVERDGLLSRMNPFTRAKETQ